MRKHVAILNDIVVSESKPVKTPNYIVHFGGNSNALCLTGDGHRSQTLNPLGVTCKVCMERLKGKGIEVNEVPYAPNPPTQESIAWDEIRLLLRGSL